MGRLAAADLKLTRSRFSTANDDRHLPPGSTVDIAALALAHLNSDGQLNLAYTTGSAAGGIAPMVLALGLGDGSQFAVGNPIRRRSVISMVTKFPISSPAASPCSTLLGEISAFCVGQRKIGHGCRPRRQGL
jgi:hypothetical protein